VAGFGFAEECPANPGARIFKGTRTILLFLFVAPKSDEGGWMMAG
jgi:hypothetical protein